MDSKKTEDTMKNDPTTTTQQDPQDSPEQEEAFEKELEQILGTPGDNAGDGSDLADGDDTPETGLDTPDDDGDDDLG